MQFVFIDEIECSVKNKDFFGLGAVVFGYYSYHKYKSAFVKEFSKINWNDSIEFKGKYLFSREGDRSVGIDERIAFVDAITKETAPKSNSRLKFIFCYNFEGNSEKNYLKLLKKMNSKIKPAGSGFKQLIAYFIDKNQKINKKKIIETIDGEKNGIVFERPFFVDSDNHTPGIITVDILNYLKSWIVLNPEPTDQLKLFSEITDTNKKKLTKVGEIISHIKNIKDINCR